MSRSNAWPRPTRFRRHRSHSRQEKTINEFPIPAHGRTTLPPFLLHPVPRRIQRQRLQDGADHARDVSCRATDLARWQDAGDFAARLVHPAVLPVLGDQRPACGQVREVETGTLREASRNRDHVPRRLGVHGQQPVAAGFRALPDGRGRSSTRICPSTCGRKS